MRNGGVGRRRAGGITRRCKDKKEELGGWDGLGSQGQEVEGKGKKACVTAGRKGGGCEEKGEGGGRREGKGGEE